MGEPELGTAALRARLDTLQTENRRMHERNSENQLLKKTLAAKENELGIRRRALGLTEDLPSRPGSARPRSAMRPRTAEGAVGALLGTAVESMGEEELRTRNAALRREIQQTRERLMCMRASTLSTTLGRDISPPPTARS